MLVVARAFEAPCVDTISLTISEATALAISDCMINIDSSLRSKD